MQVARFLTVLGLVSAVGVLAATRFPHHSDEWGIAALSVAIATSGLAVSSLWQKVPTWVSSAALLSAFAMLLLPTSPQAWLAGTPDWLAALQLLTALHAFYRQRNTTAPWAPGADVARESVRRYLRFLPAAASIAVLLLLPLFLALVLPGRVESAYELRTAIAPLLPLFLLAPAILLMEAIRFYLTRGQVTGETRTAEPRAESTPQLVRT